MIIYNDKILKRLSIFMEVYGITLFPFIILREGHRDDKVLLNHEKIHLEQQKELLVVFFYIIYFVEWLFKGYRNISFEKEAYNNQYNLDYLKTRKKYDSFKTFRNR